MRSGRSVSEIGVRRCYHKILCDVVPSEDVLAYIVYCGSCGECTGNIKCMSVGYDLILNCCSNLYHVIIVYLKPDYFFLFLFG